MATITKRGKTYLVRWYRLDGARAARTCPTKQTAVDLARDVERELALGREWAPRTARADTSYETVAAAYLTERAASRRPQTITALGYLLEHARRFLVAHLRTPDPDVGRLSRSVLLAYYASTAHLAEGTRQNRVCALADLWRWLDNNEEYDGLVPRYREIELRPPERTETVAPTWAECDAVIAEVRARLADSDREETRGRTLRAALVLRYTGLRIGQALALRWDDVDLDRATLRVRGELGKSRQERGGRTVPISPHLVDELRAWGVRTGLVCGSRHVHSIRRMLRESIDACIAAGTVREAAFDGQGTHAFRKALTSELRRAGAATDAVEYLLGHSAGIRAHYVDPDALGLRETVALIAPCGSTPAVAALRPRSGSAESQDQGRITARASARKDRPRPG